MNRRQKKKVLKKRIKSFEAGSYFGLYNRTIYGYLGKGKAFRFIESLPASAETFPEKQKSGDSSNPIKS